MAARPGLYSRAVAILKVGLPLVAIAMLAGLFLERGADRPSGDLVFTPADLAELGDGMQVRRPVLSGVTRDLDRFRFTAERVTPDAAPPTRAEIETLAGRIDFSDGTTLDLRAATGALDLRAQRMTLRGDVRLEAASGYDFSADTAEVDLDVGGLVATGSVTGNGPMGRISADRLTVKGTDAARVFLFEDSVSLVYGAMTGSE